jgi:hypothetical protein
MFKPTSAKFVRGDPDAVLIVEFAEEHEAENLRRCALGELMAISVLAGTSRSANGAAWSRCSSPRLQTAIAEVRTAGLNIMMSMKEAGKPVSFVEDCAVPLPHLADTPSGSPIFRQTRHPRHHGMRMPRKAACMCARC